VAAGWTPPTAAPKPGQPGDNPPATPPTAAATESLQEAWSEDQHPRDDDGKFVSGEALVAAKSDPAKAAELRKQVTDPGERKKLDAAIGDGKAKAKGAGKVTIKKAEAKAKVAQQSWWDAHQRGDEAEAKQQKYAAYLYHLAAKHVEDGEPDKAATAMKLADEFATGERKPTARESLSEAVAGALYRLGLTEAGFTGTDRLGRRWENGKEVPKDGGTGGGGTSSPSADPHPDKPAEAHVWGEIHDALPDAVRADAGLLAKARKVAATVYAATWNFLATQGKELIPEILDTAEDYEKISFSKMGAQGQAQHDPFMVHLGVPYSAVSVVVSKVIAVAHKYVRGKLTAQEALEALREAMTDDQRQQVAAAVAELYKQVWAALGVQAPAPGADDVLRRMGERAAG
jgi:hypothetical protein